MDSILITIPDVPKIALPKLWRPGTVAFSDTFADNRANLNGSAIDRGLGGAAATWAATDAAFKTEAGFLRQATLGTYNGAGIQIGNGNQRVTGQLMALPPAGATLNLDLRKTIAPSGSTFPASYRLQVASGGVVTLQRKPLSTGSYVTVLTAPELLQAPNVFGYEIYNRTHSMIVNNKIVASWEEENTIISGQWFELFGGSTLQLNMDWIKVENLT